MSTADELNRRMAAVGGQLADVQTNSDQLIVYCKRHGLSTGSADDVWRAIVFLTKRNALLYEVDPDPIAMAKELQRIELEIYTKKQAELDAANARAGQDKRDADAAAIKNRVARDKNEAEEKRQEAFRVEYMGYVHKAGDATTYSGNFARADHGAKAMATLLANAKARKLTHEQILPLVKQKFLELPR